MELVEGPSFAERLEEGAIPLDESLNIARQIADALEAAHEKGITQTTLKPGNIKIGPDGTVKVLDFGLAKIGGTPAAQSDHSPTMTMGSETEAGVILGTAAYMSPEQAKGKQVDQRADIYSFGVVLYEWSPARGCIAAKPPPKCWLRYSKKSRGGTRFRHERSVCCGAAWKRMVRSGSGTSAASWRWWTTVERVFSPARADGGRGRARPSPG